MEDKEISPKTNRSDKDDGGSPPKFRPKTRGMKRKRVISDSSTDMDDDDESRNTSREKNLGTSTAKDDSPNSDGDNVKTIKKKTNTKKQKDNEEEDSSRSEQDNSDDDDGDSPKCRPTTWKRRKRAISDSSTDIDDVFPENALEVEKNIIASAVKNNMDESSVKKILKKVVTNDHVLALVKIREEEEQAMESDEDSQRPKLTRSKAKELKKVSNKGPWDMALTPIKHIPVKTRPEVTALIAQELPEDEDDDEYEPTHADVPSDDDQTLESCSDLESQPRTPATPRTPRPASPRLPRDGPFKVPQEVTPARRKLDMDKEEEATIALRTRSKLSLSETPIEHIESSFVPPDDIPVPVDDLWSEFLASCLDPAPAQGAKHEDDDEADPEYNVAADPDSHDEDEEALENSIIKISKKELNDLVTELFAIMPADGCLGADMDLSENQPTTLWEGKQEPQSDDETPSVIARRISDRITFERRDSTGFSMGKMEPQDDEEKEERHYLEIGALPSKDKYPHEVPIQPARDKGSLASKVDQLIEDTVADQPVVHPQNPIASFVKVVDGQPLNVVNIVVGGEATAVPLPSAPLPLQKIQQKNKMAANQKTKITRVEVHMNSERCILPEQVIILQQQLRQHIQLAASNFLQLFVHPLNYGFGPTYKGFLENLVQIADKTPNSVADVCNLRPAMELVNNWEKKVSENTPENTEYIQFIQNDCAKWAHNMTKNNAYFGEFHPMFKKAVAESTVFLYPYLLPPRPYHNRSRRHCYLISEDELITLGLDQFWQYVVDNPKMYPPPKCDNPRTRWWLNTTLELISKHMLPFLTVRMLVSHIANVRKLQGAENPINRFLSDHEIQPVEHRIFAYNEQMTLRDHPVDELPRLWLRYLGKVEPRFRKYLNRHKNQAGAPPTSIPLRVNLDPNAPIMKAPLPLDFTKTIVNNRKKKTDANITTIKPTGVATNYINVNPSTKVYNIEGTGDTAQIIPLIIQVNAAETVVSENNDNNVIDITDNSNVSSVTTKSNDARIDSNRSTTLTVNCNNSPISSARLAPEITPTKDTPVLLNASNLPAKTNETKPSEETTTQPRKNPDHCECCIILRKVCKRQTKITEYFKEKTKKACFCKDVKLPRITKKLIHLVNTFKDPYRIAMDNLVMKLEEAKQQAKLLLTYTKKRQNKLIESKKHEIEESRTTDVEDMAYVTGYKMKLMARLGPNINLKAKVHSIFSSFNPGSDDPMTLAKSLSEVLTDQHTALFRDFLPFLTKEQAARMGRFKDYFALVCVADLVKMVEEEIVLSDRRRYVLQKLTRALAASAGELTACSLCSALLPAFCAHPRLALKMFRMFPHTLEEEDTSTEIIVVDKKRGRGKYDRQKKKIEKKLTPAKDMTSPLTVDSENDNACRPETSTASKLPPPINPECEIKIIEVSKDAAPTGNVPETDNCNRNAGAQDVQPDNTTQEDMDITLCSDSAQITTTPDVSTCQNNTDTTTCDDSTQKTADDTIEPSKDNSNEISDKVREKNGENSNEITSNQSKTENNTVDASKEKSVENVPEKKNVESGDSSQKNADVTLCGDPSQDQMDLTLTNDISHRQMDYEADHSSSGEDEGSQSEMEAASQEIKEEPDSADEYNVESNIQIFISDVKSEQESDSTAEENPETMNQDDLRDNDSEFSMVIDTDEETIKSENTEWQRDEDKLILQVIKDNIAKEQRGDKPILEFIEDKQVIHLLSESLAHKSVEEIKDRIIYLLQMLLFSGD